MTTPAPLWDIQAVADYLGISNRTVYTMVRQNRIPFVRVTNRVRFQPAEVQSWLAERSQAAVR